MLGFILLWFLLFCFIYYNGGKLLFLICWIGLEMLKLLVLIFGFEFFLLIDGNFGDYWFIGIVLN